MNRDALYTYFDQHYIPKRDMLPRLPLGVNPAEFWQEIQDRRRAKSISLPLHGPRGISYWYTVTDRMIAASEKLVETMMAQDEIMPAGMPVIAPLIEAFYTSYVEGSGMTFQAAVDYLQSGQEPRDVEEQMIANNRNAHGFVASNLYHPVDEEYLRMLAAILTMNMEGGGREFRSNDWIDIPSMMGEPYEVPPAHSIPDRVKEITAFLGDAYVHPLIKAAVAQAWVLTVRPFPEGNERLARILSLIILLRSGYSFLGDVSLSSLIARNGYPYYNAVSNIIREENGGDLTYFLEYYILLLAEAVDERARLQTAVTEENLRLEQEMAKTALPAPPQPKKRKGKTNKETVTESLKADGFVTMSPDDSSSTGEDPPLKGGETGWIGADIAREKIAEVIDGSEEVSREVAGVLLRFLNEGRLSFIIPDILSYTDYDRELVKNSVVALSKSRVLRPVGAEGQNAIYTFAIGEGAIPEESYSEEYMQSLDDLSVGSSSKDKRIGAMLKNALPLGYIEFSMYEENGEESKWPDDMKLAEQMGLITKITRNYYCLLQNVKPSFDRLDSGQKRKVSIMYENFGEEMFSLEMVVATLDYSSSTASAFLHQFTLMKILECRRGDVNVYQFLVNPREHPEVFESVA